MTKKVTNGAVKRRSMRPSATYWKEKIEKLQQMSRRSSKRPTTTVRKSSKRRDTTTTTTPPRSTTTGSNNNNKKKKNIPARQVSVEIEDEYLLLSSSLRLYDSADETAEDDVDILRWMKYFMVPLDNDDDDDDNDDDRDNEEQQQEGEKEKDNPVERQHDRPSSSSSSSSSQQCNHRHGGDGGDDDNAVGNNSKGSTVVPNPEFVHLVGHETAKLTCLARQEIVKSGMLFESKWANGGDINGKELGYIPPSTLMVCLPERRIHDADVETLTRIVNTNKCAEIVKDALQLWGLEQQYPKLMARISLKMTYTTTTTTNNNNNTTNDDGHDNDRRRYAVVRQCLMATIFVVRVFSAQRILHPRSPPNLDRVQQCLKLMNRYIKVSQEDVDDWEATFQHILKFRQERMGGLPSETSLSESESESEFESSPAPVSSSSSSAIKAINVQFHPSSSFFNLARDDSAAAAAAAATTTTGRRRRRRLHKTIDKVCGSA